MATDRVGTSEGIGRQTNTMLILVISWDVLRQKENL